jgi:hypothetical protein
MSVRREHTRRHPVTGRPVVVSAHHVNAPAGQTQLSTAIAAPTASYLHDDPMQAAVAAPTIPLTDDHLGRDSDGLPLDESTAYWQATEQARENKTCILNRHIAERDESFQSDWRFVDERTRLHISHGVIRAHRLQKNGWVMAGYLTWFTGAIRTAEDGSRDDRSNINGGVIHKAVVSGRNRRQGIATEMLQFARDVNPDKQIRHSGALSDDGAGWAAATP